MNARHGQSQLAFDFDHRAALGRDDFLVAPCNEEAVAWVDRWPDWPGPALVLYGPEGCGKSHLASVWSGTAGAATVLAASLSVDRVGDLAVGEAVHIVVEDIDTGIDQAALLHLYNRIAEHGGYLLLTARTAPARMELPLADLASRLRAAPSVEITPPDDALFAALLVKLFNDRQIRIQSEVVEFLVRRIERSFAAAKKLVKAANQLSLADRRAITIPLMRRVLDMPEMTGS